MAAPRKYHPRKPRVPSGGKVKHPRRITAMKRRRSALKLTQEDAAKRAGISVRHYRRIENGYINVMQGPTAGRLADALKTTVGDLYDMIRG